MFTHVIFDLDGTLLDTLADLAQAGNWVCSLHGWPTYSVPEYKMFIGNGAAKLLERVTPPEVEITQQLRDQTMDEFVECYNAHKSDKTTAYPGMPELVCRLKKRGIVLAVLTNKPDAAAAPVVAQYYPPVFDVVQGVPPGAAVKPDPTLLHKLMERIGAKKETTLFVGDSNVDIQTAKNGGLSSCGVLWGFRTREELVAEGADYIVDTAEALEQVILG